MTIMEIRSYSLFWFPSTFSVCFYLLYLIQYVLQYWKIAKCTITFVYDIKATRISSRLMLWFLNLVSLYNISLISLLGVFRIKSKILLKALFQTSLFIHTHSSLILCVCTKLISKSSFSITKEKNKRPHQWAQTGYSFIAIALIQISSPRFPLFIDT